MEIIEKSPLYRQHFADLTGCEWFVFADILEETVQFLLRVA